jgi:4a-hydroxytetrahydrobiopterin dehydratase
MSEQVLSEQQIENEVQKLNVAWTHIPGEGLVRVFETASFGQGLTLVNQIASVAEKLNHHPEITLRADEVDVTSVTHSAGGVTEKDLELARAIDGIGA